MKTISYTMHDGPFSGRKLTGGRPTTINGLTVVKFMETEKGKNICAKYDARPDLAALVAEYQAEAAAEKAANETRWAEQRAAATAADAPLLAAMESEAARLRSTIPADYVEVFVAQTGDADGDPILQYTVDGRIISWRDVNRIGAACAVRPGAMGAFATRWIASISRKRLAEIIAAQDAAKELAQTAKLAEEKRISDLTELARTTSTPQTLETWTTHECSEDLEDCSFDNAKKMIMPDGSTKIEYTHCY